MGKNSVQCETGNMKHSPLRYDLMDRATELAYAVFDAPTDEHITGIYERLLFNDGHGAGESGAVTVH